MNYQEGNPRASQSHPPSWNQDFSVPLTDSSQQQWAQQQQQQQQQQHFVPQQQQQQQQQQQGQLSGISLPGGLDSHLQIFSDPSNNMGMLTQIGYNATERIVKDKFSGIAFYFHQLKYYFHVNNDYVIKKLKILIVPCLHRQWKRRRVNEIDPSSPYQPPREDYNAPDLYIPTMAFITFILLVGFALGTLGQFSPEILAAVASSTLLALVMEVLLLKGVFTVIVDTSDRCPTFTELFSFCGYKYVSLILDLLIGLLFGSWMFTVAKVVNACCIGFFMMRTMKMALMVPIEQQSVHTQSQKRTKNYILVGLVFLQILIAFFLLRSVSFASAAVPTPAVK